MPYLITAAVLLALFALFLFLSFPASAPKQRRKVFEGRNYAHRGLHDNTGKLPPENTLEAFDEACRAGYGMELDIQFTRDGQVIVFHDNDLKRACGDERAVWDVDWDELKTMKLFGRDYYVPLFSDVLKTVDGRAPIIMEIKAEGLNCAHYYKLCAAAWELLRDYDGEWCMESFHPMAVRWWRKNHPQVIRGQLCYKPYHYKGIVPAPAAFMLGYCMLNFLTRPHFIAYEHHDVNALLRFNRRLGAMSVMWTSKTAEDGAELEKHHDAVIFEGYLPEASFTVIK